MATDAGYKATNYMYNVSPHRVQRTISLEFSLDD